MKTLLINGKIRISKNNFTYALGFDSGTGKITFCGNKEDAEKFKADFDEVADLGGKLVLPAFIEGHCHYIQGSFKNSQLNLRDAGTKEDFINGIREFKNKNGNKWIYGGFFSETNFKEEIKLDRYFLDEILPDTPVIISRFDTHSGIANSKALELSGLLNTGNESVFTKEEIIRDKNGEPTGEVKERAGDFILDSIPNATLSERTDIAIEQMRKFHALGITAISDITLFEDLEIYKEMIAGNKMRLRVDARLPFHELENIKKYKNEFSELPDLIQFKSLKAFYDGSLSSRTALMHENYKNTDHNGIKTEFVNTGEFEEFAYRIDEAGLQMSVHAIGDKAVTELLDLNDKLIEKFGKKDRRFRIEHAQHIQENDFSRFKDLNVIASVQPTHLFSDAKTAEEILTNPGLEHNYKKLFDIGAKVCFGTDFPIVGESPFETIYYAMTRKAPGFENGFYPENNISLDDCIDAYTINNAYATFNENETGSLTVGKLADIVVMEDDLFEMTGEEIRDAGVYETYFSGEKVFGV
ncbi:MAG TPA: amidohydrolase [Ignavibacteria bacterium]|nr:amidohydrolase [Ignavibacteria bacterium]HMR40635.1 amidohydrolase [Ignavibacteria bacterium]